MGGGGRGWLAFLPGKKKKSRMLPVQGGEMIEMLVLQGPTITPVVLFCI